MVDLDLTHRFCLGVHQEFVVHAIAGLHLRMGCARTSSGPLSSRDEANMQHLKAHCLGWLRSVKGKFLVTALGGMSLDLLGTRSNLVLEAKAHEALTLLRWLRLTDAAGPIDRGSNVGVGCHFVAMAEGPKESCQRPLNEAGYLDQSPL